MHPLTPAPSRNPSLFPFFHPLSLCPSPTISVSPHPLNFPLPHPLTLVPPTTCSPFLSPILSHLPLPQPLTLPPPLPSHSPPYAHSSPSPTLSLFPTLLPSHSSPSPTLSLISIHGTPHSGHHYDNQLNFWCRKWSKIPTALSAWTKPAHLQICKLSFLVVGVSVT